MGTLFSVAPPETGEATFVYLARTEGRFRQLFRPERQSLHDPLREPAGAARKPATACGIGWDQVAATSTEGGEI